jgi:integrase/recombinase XerD
MSTTTLSPLRQRMIEDMSLRDLAPRTQEAYIRGCRKLAAFLRRSPDTAIAEDIRLFQLHLAEQGVSICTRNSTSVVAAQHDSVGSRGQPLPQESARPRHHFQK